MKMADWRELVPPEKRNSPEFDALAGDIDLLVPLEPHWSALDLSLGMGARAQVLAHRCREVIHVCADPIDVRAIQSRATVFQSQHPFSVVEDFQLVDKQSRTFDLVLLNDESPWELADAMHKVRLGGWLVWMVAAPAAQPVAVQGIEGRVAAMKSRAKFGIDRLRAHSKWEQDLHSAGFELRETYIRIREYVWGYVPLTAYGPQEYYLNAIKEIGGRGSNAKSIAIRFVSRLHLYRYLASSYVLVAQRKNLHRFKDQRE